MKRKPTVKSLKAGQTLWYASMNFVIGVDVYELNSVRVLSDKAELPEIGVKADGFPRSHIRQYMANKIGPTILSYSRRSVETWIKRNSKVAP